MANKKTLTEMFNEIMANYELTEEHKAFIQGRIDQCAKKSANRKPTAKQTENAEIANRIYAYMVENANTVFTVTDLMKKAPAFAEIEELTNQKATAIVRGLVKANKVVRTEVKGKAYFQAVAEIEEVEGE